MGLCITRTTLLSSIKIKQFTQLLILEEQSRFVFFHPTRRACAVRSLVASFCRLHTPSLFAKPSAAMRILGRMRTCAVKWLVSHLM